MTDTTKTTEIKTKTLSNPDKPWLFQKGQSGNPLGRPKGSKNRISKLLQEIPEDDQQAIAERLIHLTRNGGLNALKICLPYLLPKAKTPPTAMVDDDAEVLDLQLDSPEDVKKASEMIIKAMIAGKISASEAKDMIAIIKGCGFVRNVT